ncbi:hypothetical protein [Dyella subtropica]|uniref:hypothetical protein n=1 Tax=Dyella subtropica TaxID=2992127 RepID=UPI00225A28F5|nr:hypothetical protein [Dyella subtropica]
MNLHNLPNNNDAHDELPGDTARTPSRLEQRLAVLRQEYEAGQTQLRALEQRSRDLQNTMLRIHGAITVLEDLLAEESAQPA